jgi:ParB family chromosome partitioning protein
MMRKSVLGRGLDALLSEDLRESVTETERIRDLSIDEIDPNPHQPRVRFDEGDLRGLAESIRRHGLLQPIVVRRTGERYQLVVGERRFRASRLAGRTTVPAVVRDIGDEDTLKLALLENLQREDLTPIEEARGYVSLRDEFGIAVKEIAEALGRDRSTIANTIRLLGLPPRVIELLEEGRLTAGHARAILAISGDARRIEWAEQAAAGGLTVRELEREKPAHRSPVRRRRGAADPQVAALEERAELRFGTRVRIVRRRKGGTVTVEFYNEDELVLILEKMGVDTDLA